MYEPPMPVTSLADQKFANVFLHLILEKKKEGKKEDGKEARGENS